MTKEADLARKVFELKQQLARAQDEIATLRRCGFAAWEKLGQLILFSPDAELYSAAKEVYANFIVEFPELQERK